MGAWIETCMSGDIGFNMTVAPYVGAWIETRHCISKVTESALSHLTWVRGLKHHVRLI